MGNSEFTIYTLGKTTEGIYNEKGSKFIGIAFPISSELDFKKKLKEIQVKYKGANHYCFAYSLYVENQNLRRSNDDGEPSGTAGKPILNQITINNLTNTAVVVVRYFGGTLLGTAGLVKAYGEAARLALEENTFVAIEKKYLIEIQSDYNHYQNIIQLLKKCRESLDECFYEDYVVLKSVIPVKIYNEIEKELLILKTKSHKIEFSILNQFY